MERDIHRGHGSALRKGRFSESGRVYLVTTVTRGREPLFANLNHARCLIGALREEQRQGRAQTMAFVVMPDHLHWLLQLQDGSLSRSVGTVKSVVSHHLGRTVWQRGFHDHALRAEEEITTVARYIIANPLRKGLVEHIGGYPHWDAIWL